MELAAHFQRSIARKVIWYLGSIVFIPMAIVGIFANIWSIENQQHRTGDGLLMTFYENSRDSIAKGQRATFQSVVNSMVKDGNIIEAGLFNREGLKIYISNQETVGLPFLIEGGQLKNPNLPWITKFGMNIQREDWNKSDLRDSIIAKEHVAGKVAAGLKCGQCHVAIDDGLKFDTDGTAFLKKDGRLEFFRKISVETPCIQCHTNWRPNETAGYLHLVLDPNAASGRANSWLTLVGAVIVIVIPILLVTAAIIHAQVSKPLRKTTMTMEQIAEGDGDLSRRLEITGKDEVGQLASAFNRFAGKIQELVIQVSGATNQLDTSSTKLAQVAEQTAHSVKQQREETAAVSSAVEDMSSSLKIVVGNSRSAAEAAQIADEAATSGQKIVAETVAAINSLAEDVANSADVIHKLEKTSINIGAILETIKGIADQTNLLALNAAIEAARAGDQGRGFAVVADEVRKLSQSTQEATTQIQGMISGLQQQAREAVNVMEAGRTRVDSTVSVAALAGNSLEKITQAVSTIRDMNSQIAQAAVDHQAVATRIHENVASINRLSETTASGAQNNERSVSELAGMVGSLQRLVSQFKIG